MSESGYNKTMRTLLIAGLCFVVSAISLSPQAEDSLQIESTRAYIVAPSPSAGGGNPGISIRSTQLRPTTTDLYPSELARPSHWLSEPAEPECASMDCPDMAPYPVMLLKEAGEVELDNGGMLSFFVSLMTSSVIASSSRAIKVFGTQIIKDGTLSSYTKKAISLATGVFIVAKGRMDTADVSLVESSLSSLETMSSLESLGLPEEFSKAAIPENLENKAASMGFTGKAKWLASKWGLINFSYHTLVTSYTRAQEYLYAAGLLSESIELFDDDDLINKLAFIRFNIPAKSRNGYFAAVSDRVSGLFFGEENQFGVTWMSSHQPYIDIEPNSNQELPVSAYTDNPYLRNLATLTDVMPEGATLRIFPGVEADTGNLNYKIALLHFSKDGQLIGQSPLVQIQKNWGNTANALWMTDKMVRGTLITQTYKPLLYDYIRGSDEHLPVYNPVNAQMIAELALAVDQINQNGFSMPSVVPGSPAAPLFAEVKQSGYNLTAVDAGGVVFYVDKFKSQGWESPEMTVKVTSIEEVDEARLLSLEEKRLNRYERTLRGQKPFDPARDRMEMAILKLYLNNIFTSYSDAATRAAMGEEQIRYPDPFFADEPLQSLVLRKAWRDWTRSGNPAATVEDLLLP